MSEKLDNPSPATPPKILVAAIAKLLKPLVRLLLNYQITYPVLTNLLKAIYVDVAENDFKVNGKRQSDSRITLLTGVHRKDVKRIRTEDRETLEIPETASTGAQIIGYWMGAREFTDNLGNPKPLPLKSDDSQTATFDNLVSRFLKQDIRPRVILDEWQRLGVAHVDNDNNVVLNTGAFTPDKGFDEKVFFFGKNIQDHIGASVHNLMGFKPSHFDRSVYYDGLAKQSVDELAALADTLGMQALTRMNKEALSRQHKDRQDTTATYRINFGVFNYNVNNSPDEYNND